MNAWSTFAVAGMLTVVPMLDSFARKARGSAEGFHEADPSGEPGRYGV